MGSEEDTIFLLWSTVFRNSVKLLDTIDLSMLLISFPIYTASRER
jgi:hypothetical protein